MAFSFVQPPDDPQQLPAYLQEMFGSLQGHFASELPAQAKSGILDLSGAAAKSVILVPAQSIVLTRIAVLYTEASSADAGVTVTVETDDGVTTYATFTSAISKSIFDVDEEAILIDKLVAGKPVVATSAGGKTGTGEVQLILEYSLDAEV